MWVKLSGQSYYSARARACHTRAAPSLRAACSSARGSLRDARTAGPQRRPQASASDHRPSHHPAAHGGGGDSDCGGDCGPTPRRRGRLPQRALLGDGRSRSDQSQVSRPRVVPGGGRAPCRGGRGEGRPAAARRATGRRWARSRPLPCDDRDYGRSAAAPGPPLRHPNPAPDPNPNPNPNHCARATLRRCSFSWQARAATTYMACPRASRAWPPPPASWTRTGWCWAHATCHWGSSWRWRVRR